MSMLGRCQEQVNAHLSRGESYRASAEGCCATSIYRTTAPITSANRDTSHCTKNWHFRAIAHPYPRVENASAKEASWGRRGQPAWQTPRQQQRHFTRGPVISGRVFIWPEVSGATPLLRLRGKV